MARDAFQNDLDALRDSVIALGIEVREAVDESVAALRQADMRRSRDLIAVGAYQPGGDPLLDMAVKLYPRLEAFLQQGIQEHETYEGALQKLAQVFA